MDFAAWNWNTVLSLFTNTTIAGSSMVGFVAVAWLMAAKWRVMIPESRLVALGLLMWTAGELLRVGWWSPAMWFADVQGYRYHLWWIDNRFLSYGPSMPLLMAGIWFVLVNLFPQHRKFFFWSIALSLLWGVGAALSWQLSELGFLFDRQVVIHWFENLVGYERP